MLYVLRRKKSFEPFGYFCDLKDAKEQMREIVSEFIEKRIEEQRKNLKIVKTYEEGIDWIYKHNNGMGFEGYYCVLEKEFEICVFVEDNIRFHIEIVERDFGLNTLEYEWWEN